MRERLFIAGGLVLFLVLFSYPVWWAATTHAQNAAPQLQLPPAGSTCVAPLDYMRTSHMRLLDQWRIDVVRKGIHQVHAPDGHVYEMSLSNTCLGCHSRAQFCDRCHAYSGVPALTCWKCHSDPHLVERRIP